MADHKDEESPDRWAAAEEYTDDFMQSNPEISAALVVGSVAAGTDGAHSDVDIRLFNNRMSPESLPKRGSGRWVGDVYADVSEVPEAWLDDAERLAGCPRNGSAFRYGRALRDPQGRVSNLLAELAQQFDVPERHARRVRIYRDIVGKRIAEAQRTNETGTPVEMCLSLAHAVMDAAAMPPICAGLSPNTIRAMIQLRSIDQKLHDRLLSITAPPGVGGHHVGKWLDDESLAAANRADPFFSHIHDQVSWIASQKEYFAAHHLLYVLVYVYIRHTDPAAETDPQKVSPEAVAIARQWLADSGWGDGQANQGKIEGLQGFIDDSIKELFPHSHTLLAQE